MLFHNFSNRLIFLTIILFLFSNIALSQSSKLNRKAFKPIANALSNKSLGSGFTTITFQIVAKGEVKIIQIQSSNNQTKKILDSLFSGDKFHSFFKRLKIGYYCFPIFQCMNNDEMTLNWSNNTEYNVARFGGKNFLLPDNTYLLKPIVVFGQNY